MNYSSMVLIGNSEASLITQNGYPSVRPCPQIVLTSSLIFNNIRQHAEIRRMMDPNGGLLFQFVDGANVSLKWDWPRASDGQDKHKEWPSSGILGRWCGWRMSCYMLC